MDRKAERMRGAARSAARRLVAGARRLLFTEPGSEVGDTVERAGAEELVRSAGALKGGMAKMAQLMAYLEGPGAAGDAEARQALGALWDHAPAADRAAIRQVVTDDLGAPPEQLFATFCDEPLAAASLGQVHAATTKEGLAVAVKVQYPGVADGLRSDLESPALLRKLAGGELGTALSDDAVERLRAAVLAELDYVAEGRWLERFRVAFRGDASIVIPKLHPKLSGPRVLTADRIFGRSLPAFAASSSDEERGRVALALYRFAWGGPLLHGLLNADPNPGNYIVQDDGRVAFLDYGCAIQLDEELVEADRRMWRAILAGDPEMLRYHVHKEGLLGRARTLDSSTYREWERYLAGPYHVKGRFKWTRAYAKHLAELTSLLVRAGGLKLPPGGLLLWRQRLGIAAVIGDLGAAADFAGALTEMVAGA